MTTETTAVRIRSRLAARLAPLHLQIRDDSARHAGHAGAALGGGHFIVTVVSAAFESRTRLEQHRLVYDALADLIGGEIHAIGLHTFTPADWDQRRASGAAPGSGPG